VKFFVHERIKMGNWLEKLISQMKGYHRSAKTGLIVKKDDHGPDAVLCASVAWDFNEIFGQFVEVFVREAPPRSDQKSEDGAGNTVDRNKSVLLF